MPSFERGRITREPMPIGRRVSREGLFEGLAAHYSEFVAASDQPLRGVGARVGENVPTDLDAAYATTIGRAHDVLASEVAAGAPTQADALVTRGGAVDALRGSVLRYLPQPDAAIETPFLPAPPNPGLMHDPRPPRDGGPPPRVPGGNEPPPRHEPPAPPIPPPAPPAPPIPPPAPPAPPAPPEPAPPHRPIRPDVPPVPPAPAPAPPTPPPAPPPAPPEPPRLDHEPPDHRRDRHA
jgi:hypothetical protein